MNKTTKIILISTGVFALGTLIYFVVRRMNKKPVTKSMKDRKKSSKATSQSSSIPTTSKNINTNSTKESVTSRNNTPIDKMPIRPVSIITSPNTPVIVTSLQSSSTSIPVPEQPDLTTSTFLRLDEKLKKMYYVLAVVDKNPQGILIYVPAEGFTPEKPNQPIGETMKQTLWRTMYNDWLAINNGFNLEERNQATKSYGNQLLNVFKTQRLDYLFDPEIYNPNQKWYKDAEEKSIKANVKTNFWKSN